MSATKINTSQHNKCYVLTLHIFMFIYCTYKYIFVVILFNSVFRSLSPTQNSFGLWVRE